MGFVLNDIWMKPFSDWIWFDFELLLYHMAYAGSVKWYDLFWQARIDYTTLMNE